MSVRDSASGLGISLPLAFSADPTIASTQGRIAIRGALISSETVGWSQGR